MPSSKINWYMCSLFSIACKSNSTSVIVKHNAHTDTQWYIHAYSYIIYRIHTIVYFDLPIFLFENIILQIPCNHSFTVAKVIACKWLREARAQQNRWQWCIAKPTWCNVDRAQSRLVKCLNRTFEYSIDYFDFSGNLAIGQACMHGHSA